MSAARTIAIDAKVVWHATQTSASPERWMGVCNELSLATEGCSLDELHSLIPETMHLLMADLVQDNELDEFLKDRGWQHTTNPPKLEQDETEVLLPWQMVVEGRNGFEHGAS